MTKKYNYKYTIKTKQGKTITNKNGKKLKASSELLAKRTLYFYYPSCEIIECKTTSLHQYLNVNSPINGLIL